MSPRSSTSIGAYPIKAFSYGPKSWSQKKPGVKWQSIKNQIVRTPTHACKIWIKIHDALVPVCELIFKDILFLTFCVRTHSNSNPRTPPHNPTLIKYRGKGLTNKIIDNTTTRSESLIPDLPYIQRPSIIHDLWTISCIGNMLAEKWWSSIFTPKIFWVSC